MKKYVLIPMLAIAGFLSCSKDEKKIDPANTAELNSKVKVYYSQALQGNIPENVAGAPELVLDDEQVVAITGRYVILEPNILSGDPVGYYVQLEGASGYFKVDYSLARNARKAPEKVKQHGFLREMDEAKASDSVIVIKLPENVTAGSFCVKVAAYDEQGQAGNAQKVCVEIRQKAGLEALNGTWSFSGKFDKTDNVWNHDVYKADTFNQYVYCVNGLPSTQCPNGQFCQGTLKMTYRYQVTLDEVVLGSSGTLTESSAYAYMRTDWSKATCAEMAYLIENGAASDHGGWSYDAAAKKLYYIYDNDGAPGTETFDFGVYTIELDGKKMICTGQDEELYEYTKK